LDQPASREVLSKILARDGYDVQSAGTVHEALEIGARFRPHVLLADWLLADDSNGLQVAESLRAVQPNMSIIFLTGLPVDRLAPQAHHVQPCTFVEKPCDFSDLLRRIRHMAALPD